ncbi:ABC transporter ATP-binding protein [Leifsonia sp. Root112D2]|uniref:ABC transporter ATP-binding protein n=1 Tax=Leifsonia sp. Root112D2 TaxID=1736426 RepID=UPI0006FA7736|nr:ATP-binding cassette domain-containing protein [Leifsonia sp. Root112D2]KQV06174.1 hypothetical protein ASC63_01465 [Leifsonia sp. Root112D2]
MNAESDHPTDDRSADDLVVRATELRKAYRVRGRGSQTLAVDGVSFTVGRGESLAIVGESGSGKTTVANMVMGLIQPTSGTVELTGLGSTPGIRRAHERRVRSGYIQLVFQDPYLSLDPRQTVGAALEEVLTLHTELQPDARAARAKELLDAVGLPAEFLTAYPRPLSGGQRQRVAIARALAADPSVIVLDEAVSALDVTVQAQVLRLLARIRAERQVSFIFISHDLAVVNEISDRILVMHRGKVVESGVTQEVMSAPQHPYTKLLMASTPRPGWVPADAVRLRQEFAAALGES